MSDEPAPGRGRRGRSSLDDGHVEQPGPAEMRDPFIREELKRASVWFGLALAIAAVIFLAQPLLLIFAGIVLASMLDGGTRLLGRVLPIGRGWRLAIVTLLAVAFIVWTFYFAGATLAGQAETPARRGHRSRPTACSPGATSSASSRAASGSTSSAAS